MAEARKFVAKPATQAEVPLLIGLIGPPGGGKTYSALRLAKGMQRVRQGPVVVIDTESGRASKYASEFEFLTFQFPPPFVPLDFLSAVKAQLPRKPAAVIIDSLSDEHEGEGGVLDWHDQEVPKMGGNEWAAWSKPKASRRQMISGFLQIKVPLLFTFRAREKTKLQKDARGRDVPVSIGYQPIAPAEVVYALDLTCILPPRAEGVPVWRSDKAGEDFVIKLPSFLRPYIEEGHALDEDTGERLARWAAGDTMLSAMGKPGPDTETLEFINAKRLELARAAGQGMKALEAAWIALHPRWQNTLKEELAQYKIQARDADAKPPAPPPEPAEPEQTEAPF